MAYMKSAILSFVVGAGFKLTPCRPGATRSIPGVKLAPTTPASAPRWQPAQARAVRLPLHASAGTRENMERVLPTRASSATASSTCSRSRAGS